MSVSASLSLPDSPEKLSEALLTMVSDAEQIRNMRAVQWWVTHYYLQGDRNFTLDYEHGRVRVGYDNEAGVDFKYEEVVKRYQEEVGQLLRLDITPKVSKIGSSLDSLRKSSISQLLLNSILSPAMVRRLKLQMIPLLVKFGMCGIVVWAPPDDGTETPDPPHPEIVPPWELLSIPPDPTFDGELCGITRARWVPVEWVRSLSATHKKKLSDTDLAQAETKEVSAGRTPSGTHSPVSDLAFSPGDVFDQNPTRGRGDEARTVFIKLCETWIPAHGCDRLARYIQHTGRIILNDKNYLKGATLDDPAPIMPIAIAKHTDTGTFFGRGLIERVIPINMEMEELLQQQFENTRDTDLFGFTLIPQTWGVNRQTLLASERPHIGFYDPDLTIPDAAPHTITPDLTGTLHAKLSEFTAGLVQRVAPSNPVTAGGDSQFPRADSAVALQYLNDSASLPLTPCGESIAAAMSTVYRCMIDIIQRMWPRTRVSRVTLIDDSLAGVVLDENGEIDTSQNVVPNPDDVSIDITSPTPKNPQFEMMKLDQALQMGLITPRWYRIEARRRGYDLPLANEVEWENYRRAVLNVLMLFRDGVEPGQAIISENDMAEVHIEVLLKFMASPEFFLASVPVREAFQAALDTHRSNIGMLPDNMPYPEEIGDQAQAGGPSGAGPMPPGMPQ